MVDGVAVKAGMAHVALFEIAPLGIAVALVGDLRLRRLYGLYGIAAYRRNQNIGRQLEDLVVRVGDTLLL